MLVLVGGISRADRRPVAVVDLSDAPAAVKLANDIRGELGPHPDLQPVISQFDETALTEPIGDEDAAALADAARDRRDAEVELQQFHFDPARSRAKDGQERLLTVTPTATTGLYAELTLTYALALFSENDTSAAGVFALVHKLAPARTLDPAGYPPEQVAAFDAARPTATGTIEIRGTGTAWLDGTEIGPAPQTIVAPIGMHYVQLTGPDRETRGASLVVVKDAKSLAEVIDAPASHDLQVHRARTLLAKASDALSRASAMQHLARLVGVEDAVLILGSTDKLRVETWRASAGFSAAVDLGDKKTVDLLTPLAPPRPKIETQPIPPPVVPVEEPRWYEDRRIQVTGAIGIVTAIVIGIVWARSNVSSQPPSQDPPMFK